ncbi:hypothetical protein BaRGS_00033107, partial [Batillaria attramentaria]
MGNTGFKPASDPDTNWRIQHTLMRKNLVYDYVDLHLGGRLITERSQATNSETTAAASSASGGGSAGRASGGSASTASTSQEPPDADGTTAASWMEHVKEIATNELKKYLYKDGKGATVIKPYYGEWCEEMKRLLSDEKEETRMQFSDSEYMEDLFNRFQPHKACWNLKKRGWMGETPLLLCYVMNTPEHIQVARALLEVYPQMALDVYEGREFFGESSLHFAVANGDFESVKLLIEMGADINQRATGRFFRPKDQKDDPSGETNYEGEAYFGEYPLAFAASRGDIKIYDYLIEKGAEPNKEDSFGNTVLHMAVIHDQREMFVHAVRHETHPAYAIQNKQKLTPLTLASKLGRSKMFRKILDLGSVENWRFGDICCSLYPLATLDSITPTGQTDWRSALWHIVKGDTDDHLEMLEGAVVNQLLKEKWMTFAKLRFTCEILVCMSCLAKMVEVGFEIWSQRLVGFLKNCVHAPSQTIYLISCVLVLLCIPFRFAELYVVEDVLLMGWSVTGPFVVMVYKMCTGDLFRFGVIYLIFLIGFTTGFFFLFRDVQSPDENVQKFFTVGAIVLNLFQMTLGEFEYEVFDSSRYPELSKLVFFVFMILMSVLLLQMLIAMMGNTYRKVISRAKKEWRRQWANMVLVLERTSFRTKSLRRYHEKYSKVLEESAQPPYPYSSGSSSRGLMVINKEAESDSEKP